MQNKTTVEHHEGVTAHAHYRELGQAFRHPYNVGAFDNTSQVLGRCWWRWLAPGIAAAGDGVRFPHNLTHQAQEALLSSNGRQQLPAAATVQLTDRKTRESYADMLLR